MWQALGWLFEKIKNGAGLTTAKCYEADKNVVRNSSDILSLYMTRNDMLFIWNRHSKQYSPFPPTVFQDMYLDSHYYWRKLMYSHVFLKVSELVNMQWYILTVWSEHVQIRKLLTESKSPSFFDRVWRDLLTPLEKSQQYSRRVWPSLILSERFRLSSAK